MKDKALFKNPFQQTRLLFGRQGKFQTSNTSLHTNKVIVKVKFGYLEIRAGHNNSFGFRFNHRLRGGCAGNFCRALQLDFLIIFNAQTFVHIFSLTLLFDNIIYENNFLKMLAINEKVL